MPNSQFDLFIYTILTMTRMKTFTRSNLGQLGSFIFMNYILRTQGIESRMGKNVINITKACIIHKEHDQRDHFYLKSFAHFKGHCFGAIIEVLDCHT